jgi:hypothetical protein
LHEDLLLAIGGNRASEPAPETDAQPGGSG